MQALSAAIAAFKRGNLPEAESLCRTSLANNPSNPAALDLLGVLAGQAGEHKAAAELIGQAVSLSPGVLAYRLNLATALIADGQFEVAQAKLASATPETRQEEARLWALRGTIETSLGNIEVGLEAFQRSLGIDDTQPSVWFNVGEAYRRSNDSDRAKECYGRALSIRPAYPEALNNLAGLQLREGEFLDALHSIQKVLQVQPRSAQAYVNLGVALRAAGDPREAIKSYRNALVLSPNSPRALYDLVTLHTTIGEFDEAEECIRKLEEADSGDVRHLVGRARIAERKGEVEKAREYITTAYQTNPDDAEVIIAYASIQDELGNTAEAVRVLQGFIEARHGNIESDTGGLFQLAKMKDALGEYDEAFRFLVLANEGRKKGFLSEMDMEAIEATTDALCQTYSVERYATLPRSTVGSNRPIFIVGMPRSGTSLTEQILASHPDVYGAGELAKMREVIEATYKSDTTNQGDSRSGFTICDNDSVSDFHVPADIDQLSTETLNKLAEEYLRELSTHDSEAKFVTDKMPYNFHVVGMIRLMFPDSAIIHCRRHPMDTCLSCYFQNFFQGNQQTFDLRNLGLYYRTYERIMRHWQDTLGIEILDLQYEDLVQDPETKVRELVSYCGLTWNDRCLSFHKSKRVIDTASYQQVRKPIYTKSVARWTHYERQLQPLAEALGDALPR